MVADRGQPSRLRHALQLVLMRVLQGLAWVLVLLACAAAVRAQNLPDAGSIQRDIERQRQVRPPVPAPQAVPAAPAAPGRADEMQFQIRAFLIQGVSLIPEAEVQRALLPWLGRPIRFSDLEKAKQAIADLYQRHGWLARPQIPEQELHDNGDLTINVIEAKFGAIRIDHETPESAGQPAWQFNRERIQKTFTARQKTGELLYVPHIERAISLLNDTPGLGVSANLTAGETAGASDVVVSPLFKRHFSGTLTRDNAGSRSTGAVKDTVSLSLDNPEGLGDQFGLSLMRSQGVDYSRFGYTHPLGYDGARMGFNFSNMRYRVIYPMSPSNPSYPRGTADTQGLSLSWPALRSPGHNVYLSGSYDRKHFVNEIYNPDSANIQSLSDKRVDVVNFSVNGDLTDGWGQGGMTLWNLGWTRGRANLGANAQNLQQDQQGPQTQGYFERFSLGLSRLQRLTPTNTLWLNLQGQRANKNLDSSEKFTLGGSQGVRGYPSAEATGDHGWLFSLETRQVLTPQWQWVTFYDHGQIRVNHRGYAGANGPTHVSLKSWGTSLNWTLPGRVIARMTWSRRIGQNPLANPQTGLDSDGSLVRNRFWLNLTALF